MGAGAFATGGAVLFAACGARVVTLGLGTAAGSGVRDALVAGGGDVTAGSGVRDALVAGGGDVTAGCGVCDALVAGGGDVTAGCGVCDALVAGGGDVTAGCGVCDALVAGGGDEATCPRAAQAFRPRITAAIIQICAADISVSPTYFADARAVLAGFGYGDSVLDGAI